MRILNQVTFWVASVVTHVRVGHIGGFLVAFAKFRRTTISFLMPVRPSVRLSVWNSSTPTGRVFVKFDIWEFFENMSQKFKLRWHLTSLTGTLREDVCTFMIISRWILLKMRNFWIKLQRKWKHTFYEYFQNFFSLRKLCRLWENVGKYTRARQ
jgi:hypothetical protein